MEGSGTFVGGPSPVSELMELVSEDFEHWWPKGDKIMWSCIKEDGGREGKKIGKRREIEVEGEKERGRKGEREGGMG